MCLSIPYQIKDIKGDIAKVFDYQKKLKKVNISMLENIKAGDWILSLNNFAYEKLSANEAQQIIDLYKYDNKK